MEYLPHGWPQEVKFPDFGVPSTSDANPVGDAVLEIFEDAKHPIAVKGQSLR